MRRAILFLQASKVLAYSLEDRWSARSALAPTERTLHQPTSSIPLAGRGNSNKFLTESTQGKFFLLNQTVSQLLTLDNEFSVNGTAIPEVHFDIGESYAGLLPIDDEEDNELYFWFFPSTQTSAKKEILIWLSGGPGCSSTGESIQENGPISWRPGTIKPVANEWSWNQLTNVIYVDQPIGSGFSQGTITARNAVDVAKQFSGFWKNFVDLFDIHDYKIFISGSSYSGQWVPYLADEMISRNDTKYFNVGGILVYNALLSQLRLTQDIPVLKAAEKWQDVLGVGDAALDQMRAISKECGIQSYYETFLVFPPEANQPTFVPGAFHPNGTYNPDCDIFWPVDEARFSFNPCWSHYNVLSTCPSKFDPLGFGESASKPFFDRVDVKKAINAPESVQWYFCRPRGQSVFVDGHDELAYAGPGSLPVIPRVIEQTANVIIGHGLLDFITFSEGTLLAIQNMTWGGKSGFQKRPARELHVPLRDEDGTFAVPSPWGELGLWHEERGLTYFETRVAGHSIGKDAPSVVFRALEVLLGRVENLGSEAPFTV